MKSWHDACRSQLGRRAARWQGSRGAWATDRALHGACHLAVAVLVAMHDSAPDEKDDGSLRYVSCKKANPRAINVGTSSYAALDEGRVPPSVEPKQLVSRPACDDAHRDLIETSEYSRSAYTGVLHVGFRIHDSGLGAKTIPCTLVMCCSTRRKPTSRACVTQAESVILLRSEAAT